MDKSQLRIRVPLTETSVSWTTRGVLRANLANSLLNIRIDFSLRDVFVGRPDLFKGVRKFARDFVAVQFGIQRLPDSDLLLRWQLLDCCDKFLSPVRYVPLSSLASLLPTA